jgi:RNA polymerase sigma-70 factor (ECF subfamily)
MLGRSLERQFERYRRRGDVAALGRVFDAVAPEVLGVAMHLARGPVEAEDLLQRTFVTAIEKAAAFDASQRLVPWLLGILANHAREESRRARRAPDPQRLPTPVVDDPQEAAERAEMIAALDRALEGVPDPARSILVLRYRHGMEPAAIADALALPSATVRSHLHRGLERVRVRARTATWALALPALPALKGLDEVRNAVLITAKQQVAVAGAGATLAASAAGGAIVSGSTTVWVAGLAVVAGAAFVGGAATDGMGWIPGPEREVEREAPAPSLDAAAPAGSGSGGGATAPTLAASEGALRAEVERLKGENQRLLARVEQAENESRAAAAPAAGKGPTFRFGEMGKLDAVLQADWGTLGEAATKVNASLAELARHAEAGTKPPKSVYLTLQENTEKMRSYEYRTIDRMPTAAQHNGELTHPISLANLAAAQCAAGGQPLSATQVAEIERLGVAFDADFTRLREGWTATKPRARRLLEEFTLKGRFTDAFFSVLSTEQRALLVLPELRGIASLDLNDPTLMVIHTSPVLPGANAAEIRTKLIGVLEGKLATGDAGRPAVERAADAFLQRTQTLLASPTPRHRLKNYTYAQALVAGEASADLVDALLASLELPADKRQALLDDPAWYVPRVVTP